MGVVHGVFAIGASSISLAAFAPFSLAFVVLVLLAIANLGGAASWTADVSKIGGWVALLDGFAAGYLGAAIVLNVTLGGNCCRCGRRSPAPRPSSSPPANSVHGAEGDG